ncbi:MAG TPA: carboxypeptidase-like regulatory domain-containing protein [Gallionellaceae bacterium]
MKLSTIFAAVVLTLALSACAPSIHGTIRLVDSNNRPIPAAVGTPEGAVVNMINVSAPVEQASHSVSVMADGKFESAKDVIQPGQYKVEITNIGYQTETRSVEVGRFSSPTVDVDLKRIPEAKRRSIRGSRSDEDKIVNPGEVNIQPPSM